MLKKRKKKKAIILYVIKLVRNEDKRYNSISQDAKDMFHHMTFSMDIKCIYNGTRSIQTSVTTNIHYYIDRVKKNKESPGPHQSLHNT